jgi:hypothetical protein
MAIMGLPQALKLIEGPIDALASLSQTQLMAMAQRNPSVLKVLPIVLNEKAEAAQRAANMAALAQGTPPSVTEQNMAVNAQAEAQPMMQMQQPSMMAAPQQMAPMDAGVASLPVPEGTYATGGIVAFEEGGQAKSGNATDAIEQLYTRELARASDPEGYRFWSEKFGPEVSADERALFIAEAAPEVQRRIAAGDTNLPEYMRVDPAARRALQSKDVTTEDFKTLANYFGNQWIGGEAEDPASLTRRDYIERPRTGYEFATFLGSRSQQHGAQPDTKQRLSNLMAPYMNVDTSETPAEMRYIGGEGNEFGYVVTNPLTGEREMAYPSGALGPTQEGRYRTSYGVHHSSIGDPDRTRYAVGLDYLIDPETGRARLVEPYLEGYQERKRNNSALVSALGTMAGAYLFPSFGLEDLIGKGITNLGTKVISDKVEGKAQGGIIGLANGGMGSTFDEFMPTDSQADEFASYRPMFPSFGEGNRRYALKQLGYTNEQIAGMSPAQQEFVIQNVNKQGQATAPAAPRAAPAPAPTPAATAPGPAPAPREMVEPRRQERDLSSFLKEIQSLMPKGEAYSESEKLVRKGMEEREQNIKNAGWLRLAEAGFGMAAGTSPYALINVAKGGAEALKGYADDLKEQRKLDRDDRKILSDIEQARRLEKRGDITAAVASYEKALDRMSAEDRTRMTVSAYRQPAAEVQLYQLWASQQPPGADKSLAKFKREMSESVAEGKDPMFDVLKRNLSGTKGQVKLSPEDSDLLRKYLPK